MAFAFLERAVYQYTSNDTYRSLRINLPGGVDSRWLGLVQPRGGVILVETNHQCTDTKGTHTTTLRVFLLDASNMFRDILNTARVLDGQTVGLSF